MGIDVDDVRHCQRLGELTTGINQRHFGLKFFLYFRNPYSECGLKKQGRTPISKLEIAVYIDETGRVAMPPFTDELSAVHEVHDWSSLFGIQAFRIVKFC